MTQTCPAPTPFLNKPSNLTQQRQLISVISCLRTLGHRAVAGCRAQGKEFIISIQVRRVGLVKNRLSLTLTHHCLRPRLIMTMND